MKRTYMRWLLLTGQHLPQQLSLDADEFKALVCVSLPSLLALSLESKYRDAAAVKEPLVKAPYRN